MFTFLLNFFFKQTCFIGLDFLHWIKKSKWKQKSILKIRSNLTEHMQIDKFVSKSRNKGTCYFVFLDLSWRGMGSKATKKCIYVIFFNNLQYCSYLCNMSNSKCQKKMSKFLNIFVSFWPFCILGSRSIIKKTPYFSRIFHGIRSVFLILVDPCFI